MQQTPDGWFFYSLALILVSALIWVVVRYTGKIDTTLAKIQETLNSVTTITSVHEQRLDSQDEKIEDIKKQIFPVSYRK